MEYDNKLDKIWQTIPNDTNVIITHGPAYGYHDQINDDYARDPNVGSKSLTKRKQELEGALKLHISGHIHEARGISKQGSITNIGASVLNDYYKLAYEPIITEI